MYLLISVCTKSNDTNTLSLNIQGIENDINGSSFIIFRFQSLQLFSITAKILLKPSQSVLRNICFSNTGTLDTQYTEIAPVTRETV